MQIIRQLTINGRKADLWQSHDAEGRKTYAVTFPAADGTRIEPSACNLYSQKAAIEAARESAAEEKNA